MKQLFNIIILCLLPLAIVSCDNEDSPIGDTPGQEYEPFLKEGKTWKYGYYNPAGKQYMKSLVVRGDTAINGLTYKKIYDVSSDGYQYALREEGKKVYCKHQNYDTPQLLYDFGKNVGEIVSEMVTQDERSVVKVLSVDYVKSGDRLLRRMEVAEFHLPLNSQENDEGYELGRGIWIEGLGSFCGLDSPLSYPGNYWNFYSCWIGDDIIGVNELYWTGGIV